MDVNTFEIIGRTENKARLFFKKHCWKNSLVFCTRCTTRKVYRIIGKKYRCKRCGYTFHDFSNRWINEVKIPYKKWLWIIKLFELELSARKIAQELYLEGLGFRSIGRILKFSNVSILNWIKAFGEALPEIKREVPVRVMEMDEMHTYIGSKKTIAGYGLLLIEMRKDSSTAYWVPGELSQEKDSGSLSGGWQAGT